MDNRPIEFECPRCHRVALAYSTTLAGCVLCGRLLYTEIPQEIRNRFVCGTKEKKPTARHAWFVFSAHPFPENKLNTTKKTPP